MKDEGNGRTSRLLLDKTRALLQASCGVRPADATHWEAALHLERVCGTEDDVLGVLRSRFAAFCEHLPWKSDPEALKPLAEVAAQLVVSLLDSGEVAQMKEAKKLVDGLLHAASENLVATEGCENLRMLEAKIKRHNDDWCD